VSGVWRRSDGENDDDGEKLIISIVSAEVVTMRSETEATTTEMSPNL